MNRLRIVRRLAHCEATVAELIAHVGLSQPLVSWHVGRLRRRRPRHDPPRRARDVLRLRAGGVRGVRRPYQAASSGIHATPTGAGRLVIGSVVTPRSAPRVRGLAQPVARAFGRIGLTPNALTVIGFAIAVVAASRPASRRGSSPACSSSSRRRLRPVRRRARPGNGKVSKLGAFLDSVFDRAARASCTSASPRQRRGRVRARCDPRAVRAGRGVHGQLRPRQIREPRLHPGHRHGQRRPRAARGPARHPHARPHPGHVECWAAVWVAHGGLLPRADLGQRVLATTLALITILATITTIQRILHVAPEGRPGAATIKPSSDQPPNRPGDRSTREHPERQNGKTGTNGQRQLGPARAQGGKIRVAIVGVGQLREQPRPGPLLLRERQGGRLSRA